MQRDLVEERGWMEQVLPKPFIPGALIGAVKAALRRAPSLMMDLASRVEIKGMTFDGAERTLHFNAEPVSFTAAGIVSGAPVILPESVDDH